MHFSYYFSTFKRSKLEIIKQVGNIWNSQNIKLVANKLIRFLAFFWYLKWKKKEWPCGHLVIDFYKVNDVHLKPQCPRQLPHALLFNTIQSLWGRTKSATMSKMSENVFLTPIEAMARRQFACEWHQMLQNNAVENGAFSSTNNYQTGLSRKIYWPNKKENLSSLGSMHTHWSYIPTYLEANSAVLLALTQVLWWLSLWNSCIIYRELPWTEKPWTVDFLN